MNKKDIILIFSLIIVFSLALFFGTAMKKDGSKAEIYSDGSLIGTYPLSEEETVNVSGKNTVKIKGGEVFMEHADCPDKICVKTGKIKNKGEQIVCLPNKLVVKVK